MTGSGRVDFLSPGGLHQNPAFTNVVVVKGPVTTIYIGGQDSIDSSGVVVGKGDFAAQSEQVVKNIQTALAAAGAELHHLVKWNVYVVQGHDLRTGLQAFQRAWGNRPNPPAISVLFVSALANPDFLLEVDAVAIVPD